MHVSTLLLRVGRQPDDALKVPVIQKSNKSVFKILFAVPMK